MTISLAVVYAVVFFRVIIVALCGETAWRYGHWWRDVYHEAETRLMRDLMLGICVAQSGLLFFGLYALVAGHVPRSGLALAILFIGDGLVALGTLLHLTTAWRLRRRIRLRRNIIIRAVLAAGIATALLLMDRQ